MFMRSFSLRYPFGSAFSVIWQTAYVACFIFAVDQDIGRFRVLQMLGVRVFSSNFGPNVLKASGGAGSRDVKLKRR
jgi:hypothetical protein